MKAHCHAVKGCKTTAYAECRECGKPVCEEHSEVDADNNVFCSTACKGDFWTRNDIEGSIH